MLVETILEAKGASVFTVSPEDSIRDSIKVLGEMNVGAVVVRNDDGEVVGILSERDVVRRLWRDGPDVLAWPVSACMTPDPYTCQPDSTVDELMVMMTERRIRHMPVVSGECLVGVVSIGDVVKFKIDHVEQEARALRDYIAS